MARLKKETKDEISALTANTVAERTYRGQKIFSRIKRPSKSKSPKRAATNHRFKQAKNFANAVKTIPKMKAIYLKGVNAKLRNVYTVALTDHLKPPVIHYINVQRYTGAVGSELRVKITDVVQVKYAQFTIINSKGEVLEEGKAVPYDRKPFIWIGTTTIENKEVIGTTIRINTEDPANNKVTREGVIDDKLVCNLSEPGS